MIMEQFITRMQKIVVVMVIIAVSLLAYSTALRVVSYFAHEVVVEWNPQFHGKPVTRSSTVELTCEQRCAAACRGRGVKRMTCGGAGADVCECGL